MKQKFPHMQYRTPQRQRLGIYAIVSTSLSSHHSNRDPPLLRFWFGVPLSTRSGWSTIPLKSRLAIPSSFINSSRAVAILVRVAVNSASPGGRTTSTKVLLVSFDRTRLNRAVFVKNSSNCWEEVEEPVKFL